MKAHEMLERIETEKAIELVEPLIEAADDPRMIHEVVAKAGGVWFFATQEHVERAAAKLLTFKDLLKFELRDVLARAKNPETLKKAARRLMKEADRRAEDLCHIIIFAPDDCPTKRKLIELMLLNDLLVLEFYFPLMTVLAHVEDRELKLRVARLLLPVARDEEDRLFIFEHCPELA